MSDVMLHGVLRMPPNLWRDDPIDVAQRHSRYVKASDRIRELEALLEACFDDAHDAFASHRKDVIEECAKVCDARFTGDLNREDQEARRCAAAIRALKEREAGA